MNEIIIAGNQKFMGKEIPVIAGGFGINQRCICDKTIAEIHNMEVKHVRESINKNINRFKENIDFMDVSKRVDLTDTLLSIGYAKQAITQAEHIYLLSERGYGKLIKIMDTDLAWDIYDRLLDEYFTLKETNIHKEQLPANIQIIYQMLDTLATQTLEQQRQAQELLEIKSEVAEVKAHQSTINTDYYTIAGYASLRGLKVDVNKARILGTVAGRLSRKYDYEIGKAYDAKYGAVNTYHTDILKEVFAKEVCLGV